MNFPYQQAGARWMERLAMDEIRHVAFGPDPTRNR
jgi:hypothetical protein